MKSKSAPPSLQAIIFLNVCCLAVPGIVFCAISLGVGETLAAMSACDPSSARIPMSLGDSMVVASAIGLGVWSLAVLGMGVFGCIAVCDVNEDSGCATCVMSSCGCLALIAGIGGMVSWLVLWIFTVIALIDLSDSCAEKAPDEYGWAIAYVVINVVGWFWTKGITAASSGKRRSAEGAV